ncbi:MAG: hypothetical protein KGY41_11025 [Desulfovermiculus sp.]|nr:hypothetical protein [Desulfovermiculus sp.]
MMNKHLIVLVLALFVAAGAGTGWFLFQQSSKLKSLNDNQAQHQAEEIRQKVVSEAINSTLADNASRNASSDGSIDTRQAEAVQANQTREEATGSWAQRSFFTSDLVQDVAQLFVEHYHPPHRPDDRGRVQISFKTLNAQYGMDFLTLHAPQNGVKEVRERVLGYAMRPAVMQSLYGKYAQKVVDALQNQADQASLPRTGSGGEDRGAGLSRTQTAEMFGLYAGYFQDLSRLLSACSDYQNLTEDVQGLLQAEQAAEQAGFLLHKADHALEQTGEKNLNRLEQEKTAAKENYRQALRRREQSKERILQRIQDLAPEMRLPSHEILYVAKWVQRRWTQGQNGEALEVASELLQDFAARLQSRRQQILSAPQS